MISSNFGAFLLASLALAVTPGPGVLYIVTRTLSQGRSAGLASVGGVALGNLVNATAASIGLAALIRLSSATFTILQFAGAAYLLFLGIQALRGSNGSPVENKNPATKERPASAFRDGAWVAILNPNTTLFFGAFLPQFIQPDLSPTSQSLALGTVFVGIALVTDAIYVFLAARMAPMFAESRQIQSRTRMVSGLVYLALGFWAAISGGRSTR